MRPAELVNMSPDMAGAAPGFRVFGLPGLFRAQEFAVDVRGRLEKVAENGVGRRVFELNK